MNKISLLQEELITIASMIMSERLLYLSATNLSVDEVNNIIDDKNDMILSKLCNKKLCSKVENKYVFSKDIMFIVRVCEEYIKKLDLLCKNGEKFTTQEVFFISYEGIISISFYDINKEFTICYESEQKLYEFLSDKLGLCKKILNSNAKFNVSIEINKLGKLIDCYDNQDKKNFEKICSKLKIEQEIFYEFIESTLENNNKINLIFKENGQEGKNESDVIYINTNNYYLVKTYSDNRFTTIVHDDSIEVIKVLLNIE